MEFPKLVLGHASLEDSLVLGQLGARWERDGEDERLHIPVLPGIHMAIHVDSLWSINGSELLVPASPAVGHRLTCRSNNERGRNLL